MSSFGPYENLVATGLSTTGLYQRYCYHCHRTVRNRVHAINEYATFVLVRRSCIHTEYYGFCNIAFTVLVTVVYAQYLVMVGSI